MNPEDIDKIFQEGTQEHFPYDETLWQEVEASLPVNDSKRRGFYYWALAAGAFIFVLTISWFAFNSLNQEKLYLPRTVNQFEELEKADEPDSFSMQNKKQAPDLNALQNGLTQSAQHTSIAKAKANEPQNQSVEKGKDLLSQPEVNSPTTKQSSLISEPAKASKISSQAGSEAQLNSSYSLEENGQSSEASLNANKLADLPAANQLTLMSALGLNREPLTYNAKKAESLKNYPKDNNSLPLLEFQYNQSVSLANRNNSQGAINSMQLAVLGIKEKGNFSYGTGLRYAKFREQLNYQVESERLVQITEFDTNVVLVNANYSQNGIPVWLVTEEIRATTREEQIRERSAISRESILNSIQLPVFIGFQKPIGRFELGTRGSFVVNYVYRSSGAYYDEDQQQFIQLEDASASDALFLNLEAAIRLGYQLNEFSKIGTTVRYQYSLSELQQYNGALFDGSFFGIWLQHQFK